MAIFGDTLAIGVPQEEGMYAESGAVYVYRFDGKTWNLEGKLVASLAFVNWFGKSVSLSEDRIAVGVPWHSGGVARSTFTRTGTTWGREAVLRPQYSTYEDYFGMRLSLSGDGLAVAVPNNASRMGGINPDPSNTEMPRSGAVVVFRNPGSAWQQEAFIKAPYPDAEDDFGSGLALSGSELVVGMQYESSSARGVGGNGVNNRAPRSGAAYVYAQKNGTWRLQSYIKSSNSDAGSIWLRRGTFGWNVGDIGVWRSQPGERDRRRSDGQQRHRSRRRLSVRQKRRHVVAAGLCQSRLLRRRRPLRQQPGPVGRWLGPGSWRHGGSRPIPWPEHASV